MKSGVDSFGISAKEKSFDGHLFSFLCYQQIMPVFLLTAMFTLAPPLFWTLVPRSMRFAMLPNLECFRDQTIIEDFVLTVKPHYAVKRLEVLF